MSTQNHSLLQHAGQSQYTLMKWKLTCSGEGLANVKWLCSPSSRITEQNLIWCVEKLQWKFIPIPIPTVLFPFPYFYSHFFPFPWYSHSHSHGSCGNPMGPMGSQLFPYPCTSLPSTSGVRMQLTRDLFAIAEFLVLNYLHFSWSIKPQRMCSAHFTCHSKLGQVFSARCYA